MPENGVADIEQLLSQLSGAVITTVGFSSLQLCTSSDPKPLELLVDELALAPGG